MFRSLVCPLLLIAGALPGPSRAAQSYDSCTGYIEALPASITSQGTWCLRGHKYTSQTSGSAIYVLTDNVTIDCNHFRLSGLGAGASTNTIGVITGSASRLNTTLRNCRIQGFKYGAVLSGANHLVERNRFDYSTYVGISVYGDQHVVRENEVMTTGGRPGEPIAYPIYTEGVGTRISGNTVHGVKPAGDGLGTRFVFGIRGSGVIEDNHVSGLDVGTDGLGYARGILASGACVIRRNTLVQGSSTPGIAIIGSGIGQCVCRDNNIIFYQTGLNAGTCDFVGSNLFLPAGPLG